MIKWRVYATGTDSKLSQPTTKVVQDEAEWQKFWTELTGNPASTAPKDVKWNSEMLVCVAAGEKPIGTTVMVSSIDRDTPSEAVVRYVEVPPAWAGDSQFKARPYEIVRLSKPGARIKFSKTVASTMQSYVPAPIGIDQGTQCPWTIYDTDWTCSINNPTELVIQDRPTFDKYWQASIGAPAPIDVNFESETLVAIHLGRCLRSGYDVWVQSVSDMGSGATMVSYVQRVPSVNQHARSSTSSPFVVIRIPKTSNVVFKKRTWDGTGEFGF